MCKKSLFSITTCAFQSLKQFGCNSKILSLKYILYKWFTEFCSLNGSDSVTRNITHDTILTLPPSVILQFKRYLLGDVLKGHCSQTIYKLCTTFIKRNKAFYLPYTNKSKEGMSLSNNCQSPCLIGQFNALRNLVIHQCSNGNLHAAHYWSITTTSGK